MEHPDQAALPAAQNASPSSSRGYGQVAVQSGNPGRSARRGPDSSARMLADNYAFAADRENAT